MKMRSYWLYLYDQPIHAVRLPEGASDHEVRMKAMEETDRCPGVVCKYPFETPGEHRTRIINSTVRTFESEN